MKITVVPNKSKSDREFCTAIKKRVGLMNARGLIVMNVRYIKNEENRMPCKGAVITYKKSM